ncbi:MAG: endonuclease/exonuclease/phosphatase family protein [Rhizobiaceae bacterium]
MPFYNDLRPESDFEEKDYLQIFPTLSDETKIRTIDGIIRLKSALYEEILPRKSDRNLLIASWNIKEFGHTKQRLPEAYFYIAEIVSHFDLVVVQEVKSTLKDLSIVMRLLGSEWDYLVSDITSGTDGNSERSAYIFNSKRVKLSGIAGELVLWDEITADSDLKQLKRSPYLTGFRSGWKNFAMLSLHLHPGDEHDDLNLRREEVRLLLKALDEKRKGKHSEAWTSRLIIAGDFNFYRTKDDPAIQFFDDAGFREIESLIGIDTNVSGSEVFDRMFIRRDNYFRIGKGPDGKECGGVFDPFGHVYRDGEEAVYKEEIIAVYGGTKDLRNDAEALRKQFQTYWKRNQISDHLPIWFELSIDDSVSFLENKRNAIDVQV